MDYIVRVKMPLSSDDLAQLQTLGCDGPYEPDDSDAYFYAPSGQEDALRAMPCVLEVKPVPERKHTLVQRSVTLNSDGSIHQRYREEL